MMRHRADRAGAGTSPITPDTSATTRRSSRSQEDSGVRRHCRHHLVLWCLAFLTVGLLVVAWLNVRRQPAKLLVVSVAALRWDYLSKVPAQHAPFFTGFLQDGSRAEWLGADFLGGGVAVRTSIWTGLYPEQHGVLADHFVDSQHGEMSVEAGSADTHEWWSDTALPIWHQAAKQWRDAAVYNVHGACVQFEGFEPRLCRPARGHVHSAPSSSSIYHQEHSSTSTEDLEQRLAGDLNDAITRLQHKHYHMAVVHTDLVQRAAEMHGADSSHVLDAVQLLDKHLRRLDSATAAAIGPLNVVIVSDGGLTDTKHMREISLDEHMPANTPYTATANGAMTLIYTESQHAPAVQRSLNAVSGLTAFLRADIPSHLHVTHEHRAPAVLALTSTSYYIENTRPLSVAAAGGYDNTDEHVADMRGVLLARGVDFKKGVLTPPTTALDVHALLCHLLWLPNTGHGSVVRLLPMIK